jgi:hypothetical protein
MTDFQPVLPLPVPFTEAEKNLADEEPPSLFPDNQNSNWGFLRKIFADKIQEISDQIGTLYQERFPLSSQLYLDKWEYEVGLPSPSSSLSTAQRRQAIVSRLNTGLFTRTRRKLIVENYLAATYGDAIQLTPSGVALVPAGVPIYSGLTAGVGTLYTITEDIPNFHYTVTINPAVTPDLVNMTRELERITPSGISFDIVQSGVTPPAVRHYGDGTYGSGTYGGF